MSTTGKPLKRAHLDTFEAVTIGGGTEAPETWRSVSTQDARPPVLLKQALPDNDPAAQAIREVHEPIKIQDDGVLLELHPLGHASGPGNLAVLVPHRSILFAGEVCSNGPKNDIARGHNSRWIEAIGRASATVGRDRRPRFRRHRGPRDSSAAEGLPCGTAPACQLLSSRSPSLVTSSLAGSSSRPECPSRRSSRTGSLMTSPMRPTSGISTTSSRSP